MDCESALVVPRRWVLLSLAGKTVSHYSRMTTKRRRRRRTVDECDFDGVAVRSVAVVATGDSFAADCYVTALSKAEVVNLRAVL